MDNTQPHQNADANAPADADNQPQVDFSAAEAATTVEVYPANGSHLVKIVEFVPVTDQDAGIVSQWKFTLDAAEAIDDSQKPPQTLAEGTRLGTFTVFISPSQYRSLQECIDEAKKMSMALNDIVRDPRTDPQYKRANAAWAALPMPQKRPMFTGTPAVMDNEPEWYSQWNGTVVLATLNTRTGKDGTTRTNLTGLAAKSFQRPNKRR